MISVEVNLDARVKQFRHGGDAGHQARGWAAYITVRFKCVDAIVANGGNCIPLGRQRQTAIFIARLLGGVAARGDQQNVWCGVHHVLVRNAE